MDSRRDLVWWTLAAIAAVVLMMYLFIGPSAWAGGTATYTDESGAVTGTERVPADGRLKFRIKTPSRRTGAGGEPLDLAIESVLVRDDTGQMQTACFPMSNDQEIAVTSEVVPAVAPVVTITGVACSMADCTGAQSEMSNPITVEFVPEPPGLLGPLPE